MDNPVLIKFMAKLASNKELLDKFQTALSQNTKDEAYKLALENSEGTFTKEEFENYISEISKQLLAMEKTLLSEKNLELVAGGGPEEDKKKEEDEKNKKSMAELVEELTDRYDSEMKVAAAQEKGNKIRAGIQVFGLLPMIFEKIGKIKASSDRMNKKYKSLSNSSNNQLNLAKIETLEKELRERGAKLD